MALAFVVEQADVMSVVTNVMVLAWAEDVAMEPFTRADESRAWRGAFSNVARGASSDLWVHDGKGPECDVWVGAFNHLNRAALFADLEALAWMSPCAVQVLVKWQDDDCWSLWMLVDARLTEVSLPGAQRCPHQTGAHTATGWIDIETGVLSRGTC